MAAEDYELDSYPEGPSPQGPGKAWGASCHSTSRGEKHQKFGSPVLSVSKSHCPPPFPHRLTRTSLAAGIPSSPTPTMEPKGSSPHVLGFEPFQGSPSPLGSCPNSPTPRKALSGNSGPARKPHLLRGLTPLLIFAQAFAIWNSPSLASVHLPHSFPLFKMHPRISSGWLFPTPLPCAVLLSPQ